MQITLAASLYDRGLVMTRVPMESLSDDDDSCDTMSQSTVDSAGETWSPEALSFIGLMCYALCDSGVGTVVFLELQFNMNINHSEMDKR